MASAVLDRPRSKPAPQESTTDQPGASWDMKENRLGPCRQYSNNELIIAIEKAGKPLVAFTRSLNEILASGDPIEGHMLDFLREEYDNASAQLVPCARYAAQKWGAGSGGEMPKRVQRTCDWIDSVTKSFVVAVHALEERLRQQPYSGDNLTAKEAALVQETLAIARQLGRVRLREIGEDATQWCEAKAKAEAQAKAAAKAKEVEKSAA